MELVEQHELVVATAWIDQTCSVPGCTVVIRSRAGEQASGNPVCKWCQSGTAYYRRAMGKVGPPGGPYMSIDEFGRDLYDAIVLRAAAVTASQLAERHKARNELKAMKQAEQQAATAEAALHKLLDRGTIAPQDVRRLLKIT
jgi:hypothetical protein